MDIHEESTMRLILIVLISIHLAGCAQPQQQAEQPKPNGAYLIIDGKQAQAVLVIDGKRIEEAGQVIEVAHMAEGSLITASYLVYLPNCGQVQWLRGRTGEAESRFLQAYGNEMGGHCAIATAMDEVWTALDYSG